MERSVPALADCVDIHSALDDEVARDFVMVFTTRVMQCIATIVIGDAQQSFGCNELLNTQQLTTIGSFAWKACSLSMELSD